MIEGMNHITLAVTDINKSFAFYRDILGLRPLAKWDKGAYFLVGNKDWELWFCLNVDSDRKPSPCYTHYAFSVSEDQFQAMASQITGSGARVFKDNTSPGESLYFLDPDGHKLEIHVGHWRTRVAAKKADEGSWKDVEWLV